MKSVQLLDVLARDLSERYVWRAPFVIEARTCGTAGADWNIETRTLTFCYELAKDFAFLFASYGPGDARVPSLTAHRFSFGHCA